MSAKVDEEEALAIAENGEKLKNEVYLAKDVDLELLDARTLSEIERFEKVNRENFSSLSQEDRTLLEAELEEADFRTLRAFEQ